MKRWTTLGVIASISAAFVSLAACGGADSSTAAPTNKLTVWMMTGGPGDNKIIDDVTKQFHQKHPDVQVKVEVQQWDNIVTKLTTALASDNPPDIVEMGNTQTPMLTASGALAELTADKAGFESSDKWLAGLAGPSTYQDKLYAAPLYGGTKVVMYSKKMFAAAGIAKPPVTLDELVADCATLAKAHTSIPNFSAFYMPGQYWFAGMPFLFGKGGKIATEDNGKWTATMSSAENQAGLAEWKKFQNACSTPSSIGANTDSPDQDQIFADQKAAMIYVKAWEPGAVKEINAKAAADAGYFIMPGYEAGAPLPVIVAGSTIGIAQNSPNKETAVDWLKIITGKTFQQTMTQTIHQLPVVTDFLPTQNVPDVLKLGAQAATVSQALPATPGEATLETESYNEQFFAKIAKGSDIGSAAGEYDKHATEAFNAQSGPR
ncbi:extracellular solute-binding protein [Kribbella capetownensis]|uniref:Extracellular solute-binding protein n=1 Tax=Kribbella capetownensis TaxID=1572659 RepID=A0A4R0JI06_9ACTN|nr:extracellular solute-binding protein [Kribbella capetownensis]TCC44268.1 extracellular solute-binding protein [Kribbella capetownensis]